MALLKKQLLLLVDAEGGHQSLTPIANRNINIQQK
jgi:hypothetical protein